MWGIGSYFAVNASYSNDYSYHRPDGKKQFFLAEVITGEVHVQHKSDSSIQVAPWNYNTDRRYDTSQGKTNGSIIYIAYEDHRAFPKYLLTYSD